MNEENFKLMQISDYINREIKNFKKTPQLDYAEKMVLNELIKIEKVVHTIIGEKGE